VRHEEEELTHCGSQGEIKMLGVTAHHLDGPKPTTPRRATVSRLFCCPYSLADPAALMADLVALNQFESEQERKVR
jgi:hypothetical protein